jgi:hypothetical protein
MENMEETSIQSSSSHIPQSSSSTIRATRLLENPVEATTIVQNFGLLLVENVV